MYLKSFKLINFRKFGTENNVIEFVDSVDGVQSEKVDISKSTTLIVGKNNSGKTTITKAFEKLIGKSKFEASDFNFCYLSEFLDKYMEDTFEQFPVIEFELIIGIDNDTENKDRVTNIAPFLNIEDTTDRDFVINAKYEFIETTLFISKVKKVLQRYSGDNISDYLESLFEKYNDTEKKNFKLIIKQLFELEDYTFEGVLSYLLNLLFLNIDNDNIDASKEKVRELLRVNIDEYLLWFNFINRSFIHDVIYHTYHGTKGEEYDNVIIIMQNNFGPQGQNKFSSFFAKHNNEDLEGDEKDKFINTRNLLYVSCSRAIRNLRILYLDDVSEFKNGIETIFGEIYDFDTSMNN